VKRGDSANGDAVRKDEAFARREIDDHREWQEFVEYLVNAKRQLAGAWSLLDGTDRATDESQLAFGRATEAIDDVYRSEAASEWNADVAAPEYVQEFWDKTEQRPGFAIGT
jgi:hypothetical protein